MARIYLPDKAIHGPDAKRVVVFKGSAGEILDPAALGGLSDTTAEDFAGPGIEYQKRSAADVLHGRSTLLEHSTTAWEEQADRQQRGQALEQVQAAPVQAEGMSR